MPVLRHLQPVSLELKKCSNKYPQLFFKVRIFETSRLVYAGTAQQVFEKLTNLNKRLKNSEIKYSHNFERLVVISNRFNSDF